MKQLINKYNRRIRLVGLEDVLIEGNSGEARGERPRIYYRFDMPMDSGDVPCLWSGREWELADYGRQPKKRAESLEFRENLEEAIRERGFSASGLGVALGKSRSWLHMVVRGKRLLPSKYDGLLERELGLPGGSLAGWRKAGKNSS